MLNKIIKFVSKHSQWMMNERGGGSKTEVVSAPTTPAPSSSQSAEDLYKTRLQYDPQTAEMEYKLAQQYAPLYGALYAKTAEEQFPGIGALQRTGTEASLGQLKSAYGLAPEDQYSINERNRLREQARATRNVGGGLYGGRGYAAEDRAVEDLSQSYRTQAQQQTIPYMQILYPQISQTPAVSRPTTPGGDTLYNAMFQSSQPNQYYNQGSPSPLWGLAGGLGGAAMGGWSQNWGKKG